MESNRDFPTIAARIAHKRHCPGGDLELFYASGRARLVCTGCQRYTGVADVHLDVVRTALGIPEEVPVDAVPVVRPARPAPPRWWCPIHPDEPTDYRGRACRACRAEYDQRERAAQDARLARDNDDEETRR